MDDPSSPHLPPSVLLCLCLVLTRLKKGLRLSIQRQRVSRRERSHVHPGKSMPLFPPILPLKAWKIKGKGGLSQAYHLTLALNTSLSNIYPRSPTQGLLEEVGLKDRGTQGRRGSNPSVAWKCILQIYVSRNTGSGGGIACQPGALGSGQ